MIPDFSIWRERGYTFDTLGSGEYPILVQYCTMEAKQLRIIQEIIHMDNIVCASQWDGTKWVPIEGISPIPDMPSEIYGRSIFYLTEYRSGIWVSNNRVLYPHELIDSPKWLIDLIKKSNSITAQSVIEYLYNDDLPEVDILENIYGYTLWCKNNRIVYCNEEPELKGISLSLVQLLLEDDGYIETSEIRMIKEYFSIYQSCSFITTKVCRIWYSGEKIILLVFFDQDYTIYPIKDHPFLSSMTPLLLKERIEQLDMKDIDTDILVSEFTEGRGIFSSLYLDIKPFQHQYEEGLQDLILQFHIGKLHLGYPYYLTGPYTPYRDGIKRNGNVTSTCKDPVSNTYVKCSTMDEEIERRLPQVKKVSIPFHRYISSDPSFEGYIQENNIPLESVMYNLGTQSPSFKDEYVTLDAFILPIRKRVIIFMGKYTSTLPWKSFSDIHIVFSQ